MAGSMYSAARRQAEERADREQGPMGIYKGYEPANAWDVERPIYYVRSASEGVPRNESGIMYLDTIHPKPVEAPEPVETPTPPPDALFGWGGWSKPRERTFCDSCGEETSPTDRRPWACSSRCYADIVGICHPDY